MSEESEYQESEYDEALSYLEEKDFRFQGKYENCTLSLESEDVHDLLDCIKKIYGEKISVNK